MPRENIDASLGPRKSRKIYDSLSRVYGYLTFYEGGAKKRGLEVAGIQPHENVLEVGFGTGHALIEIARIVDVKGNAFGIDLSGKMAKQAERLLARSGTSRNASIAIADSRRLPFKDNYFDIVFSSYMLDLMSNDGIASALSELERVLRVGGRIVLVNLSKGEKWHSDMRLYEWFYRRSPSILGGCRPLLMEHLLKDSGFINVHREFLLAGHVMPSEISYGEKTHKN